MVSRDGFGMMCYSSLQMVVGHMPEASNTQKRCKIGCFRGIMCNLFSAHRLSSECGAHQVRGQPALWRGLLFHTRSLARKSHHQLVCFNLV